MEQQHTSNDTPPVLLNTEKLFPHTVSDASSTGLKKQKRKIVLVFILLVILIVAVGLFLKMNSTPAYSEKPYDGGLCNPASPQPGCYWI